MLMRREARVTETHKYVIKYRERIEAISRARERGEGGSEGGIVGRVKEEEEKKKGEEGEETAEVTKERRRS